MTSQKSRSPQHVSEEKAYQSIEKDLAEYKTFFENISPLLDKLDKSPELVQAIVDGGVYNESTLATFTVSTSEKSDNRSKLHAIRAVDLLIKHPGFCINLLSQFYIFNEDLLKEFLGIWHDETESCHQIYSILSHVQCVQWTEELIEKYSGFLHADSERFSGGLCSNGSIPWTAKLIEKYKEELQEVDHRWYDNSSYDYDIFLREQRIEEARENDEYNDDGLPAWENIAEVDSGGFRPTTSGFDALSSNKGVFWSVEIIEQFQDYWNWRKLSSNESIPWSDELIAKFHDRWDRKLLNETLVRIFDQDHTVNNCGEWQVPYGLNWKIYLDEDDVIKLLDLLEAETNPLEEYGYFLANTTIWQKIFSQVLNDDLVAWIIRRLLESDKVRVDEESASYDAAHLSESSASASAPQDKDRKSEGADLEMRVEDISF